MAAAKVYGSRGNADKHDSLHCCYFCVVVFCMQSTKDKIYCKSLNSPSIFIYLMTTAKKPM